MNCSTVISRKEAKAGALKHYFTGKPCKHGHIARRYTNSRICAHCLAIDNRRDESIARVKRWYSSLTHREKMLTWAKYRHARKGYPGAFDITETDLDWPTFCPALGLRLRYEAQRSRNANDAPTIDRIDPRKGYVKGNVQVISRLANRIKNDGTPDQVMRVALFMAAKGART